MDKGRFPGHIYIIQSSMLSVGDSAKTQKYNDHIRYWYVIYSHVNLSPLTLTHPLLLTLMSPTHTTYTHCMFTGAGGAMQLYPYLPEHNLNQQAMWVLECCGWVKWVWGGGEWVSEWVRVRRGWPGINLHGNIPTDQQRRSHQWSSWTTLLRIHKLTYIMLVD